jgi:hypothetical protein
MSDDNQRCIELLEQTAVLRAEIERLNAVLDGIVNKSLNHQDAILRAKWRAREQWGPLRPPWSWLEELYAERDRLRAEVNQLRQRPTPTPAATTTSPTPPMERSIVGSVRDDRGG